MDWHTRLQFIFVAVWFTLWLFSFVQTMHKIVNPSKMLESFAFDLKFTLLLFTWTVFCSIALALNVTQLVDCYT